MASRIMLSALGLGFSRVRFCRIMCIRAHRLSPAKLVIQLKGAATEELRRQELHPFGLSPRPPKCFARGQWAVFLDTDEDVLRAIRYVEENPVKDGLPRQRWRFVTALD